MDDLVDPWDIYDLPDHELERHLAQANLRLPVGSDPDPHLTNIIALLQREMLERGLSNSVLVQLSNPKPQSPSSFESLAPLCAATETTIETFACTSPGRDSPPRRGLWDSSGSSDSDVQSHKKMPPLMRRTAGGFVSMRCPKPKPRQNRTLPKRQTGRSGTATPVAQPMKRPPVPRFNTPPPACVRTNSTSVDPKPRKLSTLLHELTVEKSDPNVARISSEEYCKTAQREGRHQGADDAQTKSDINANSAHESAGLDRALAVDTFDKVLSPPKPRESNCSDSSKLVNEILDDVAFCHANFKVDSSAMPEQTPLLLVASSSPDVMVEATDEHVPLANNVSLSVDMSAMPGDEPAPTLDRSITSLTPPLNPSKIALQSPESVVVANFVSTESQSVNATIVATPLLNAPPREADMPEPLLQFEISPDKFASRFPSIASLFVDSNSLRTIRKEDAQSRAQAMITDSKVWFAELQENEEGVTACDDVCWFKVQRSRPEVYELWSQVAQLSEAPLLVECTSPTWDLWWSWRKPRPKETTFLASQQLNHIPKTSCLTQKDQLKTHVQRLSSGRGTGAAQFNILPLTFNLPREYVQFASALADKGGLWIMKTVGMSRGRGISIVAKIEDVMYSEPVVVQRYIDRPALIAGSKFDLRLYVIVTQFSPLEAFISTLGFARFAARPYSTSLEKLTDLTVHLTNTAVSEQVAAGGKNKWSLQALSRYMEANGTRWAPVWDRVKSTVLKTLVAVEDTIPNSACTFELFGFDVILDEELRPWVLEVNASPSMEMYGALDTELKPQLMMDIIALLRCTHIDRHALQDLLKWISVNGGNQVPADWGRRLQALFRGTLPRTFGDLTEANTSFDRIAPSDDYAKLVKAKKSCV